MTVGLRGSLAAVLVCLVASSPIAGSPAQTTGSAAQTTDPGSSSGQPAQGAGARPCVDVPEHRQLDFWIGEWDVTSATATSSTPPARSRIELIEDQCVIFETYRNPSGYSGRSLNAYQPDKKRWQQFWMDNKGDTHQYVGHFRDGNLYFRGEGIRVDGPESPPATVKMTFFNQGPDQVRQLGEKSTDGRTWTVAYDLIYRRRKESASSHCTQDAGGGEVAEVRAVVDGLIEADNATAIERVLDLYAPDALLLPPNETPVGGHEVIRRRYQSLFSSFSPAIESRIDEVCVSGPMAFVRGHNTGRMVARGGGADRILDDTYVMLLRKDARQRWRISHLSWH